MNAIVSVMGALPLAFFMRSRHAANTTYAVVYLWAFVFQTLYLSFDGSAFGDGEFPLSYGRITCAIFAVSLGLVAMGHAVRGRPDARARVAPGTGSELSHA